ncbi:MAG: hypothetical protein IKN39_02070 [Clostridia bacterium]|nr:hypothetical protein [Clostridia bacterium]
MDDGAYLATKIVIEVACGTDITELLSPLKMPADELECRIGILNKDFKQYGNTVISELEKYIVQNSKYTVADDSREGIRVSNENGWFLLRLSVHDPVMPLNFESDTKSGIKYMISDLKPFFSRFDMLSLPDILK